MKKVKKTIRKQINRAKALIDDRPQVINSQRIITIKLNKLNAAKSWTKSYHLIEVDAIACWIEDAANNQRENAKLLRDLREILDICLGDDADLVQFV